MREGSRNGNWKGGLSSVRTADDVLKLDKEAQTLIKNKILDSCILIESTNCWNWTRDVFRSNRRACINLGVRLLAARVSYVVFRGPIGNLCVLHTCDNVYCVNPDHLWLGTNADNSADMVRKKRCHNQDGSKNNMAKLDEAIVVEIKARLANGEMQNKLAKEYNVSNQTINNIAHNKGWKHV